MDEGRDLIIVVETEDHPVYKRTDNHLHLEKKVLLAEALVGLEFVLKTIKGDKVLVKTPDNTVITPDSIHVLRGMGMDSPHSTCGDVYISYKIQFPESLTQERKDILSKVLPTHSPLSENDYPITKLEILSNLEEDDEEGGGMPEGFPGMFPGGMPGQGPGGVQCAQQ